MRRFNYDDDEFQDENFFPDTNGEDEEEMMRMELAQQELESMQRREALDLMQLELVEVDLNQRLLFKAIKMLEKSWLWRFRRTETKLKLIAAAYTVFKSILQPQSQEEEKEV